MAEADEDRSAPAIAGTVAAARPEDNSLGRLLTLSDGVFAIAMTLLALDLRVPDVGSHPSDRRLIDHPAAAGDSYWSYALTFYVIALYWLRHRRLLRAVTVSHDALIRDRLILLFVVAAMPFPASLLGRYGGDAISLALYGAVNLIAMGAVILTSWDVHRLGLADPAIAEKYHRRWGTWWTMMAFALVIPAGFVFGSHGAYVLLLLVLPDRAIFFARLRRRRRAARSAARSGTENG